MRSAPSAVHATKAPFCAVLRLRTNSNLVGRSTFIGRIERGFGFLGYHFGPAGLAVAKRTLANFIAKASRVCAFGRRDSYDPTAAH
jgi:hypothetical protein